MHMIYMFLFSISLTHLPNKRHTTIIFSLTLTAHIWLSSGHREVIEPPKDTKFYEEHGSSRPFDIHTLYRDVKVNRCATLIRKERVSAKNVVHNILRI